MMLIEESSLNESIIFQTFNRNSEMMNTINLCIKNGLVFKIVFGLLLAILISFICLLFKIVKTDVKELHIKTLLNSDVINVQLNVNATNKEEKDKKIFEIYQKLQNEFEIDNIGFLPDKSN